MLLQLSRVTRCHSKGVVGRVRGVCMSSKVIFYIRGGEKGQNEGWLSGAVDCFTNNFVLGDVYRCLGLVHFSTHSPVDEDPAKCVYRQFTTIQFDRIRRRSCEDDMRGSIVAPHCSTTSFSYQSLHHTMTSRSTVCCDQIRCLWRTWCGAIFHGAIFHTQQNCQLMINHHDDGMLVSACRY
jgi:hypothetical protein